MASLVVAGDTSGSVTITAPAVAGTTTLTLPTTTGTLVVTGGAQTIEFADGSASAPSITNSGDTNTGIFFPAADTIAFTEGGTESMRIDSSGNVGIGTSTITSDTGWIPKLVLSATTPALVVKGSSGQECNFGVSNSLFIDSLGHSTGTNNNIIFRNTASNSTYSATERMRIDSSGQLLVGTTSALAQTTIYKAASGLQVSSPQLTVQNGVSDGATGDGPGINFANSSGAVANLGITGDGAFIFSNRASTGAGWAERMRLISGGQLIIGKTTTAFGTNGIYFNQIGQGLFTYENNADVGGAAIYINRRTFDGAVMLFYKDTNNVGSISVTASSCSFNNLSDYRIKENIAPMTGALTKVQQLKPCTYTFKQDNSIGEGFIAHELAEVCPQAVTGEKDAVDAEGKPIYQGVDTSFLVATLTAAIQEQQAIITDLKARIETLENK